MYLQKILFILISIVSIELFPCHCGNTLLTPLAEIQRKSNDTLSTHMTYDSDRILKRDKRYLLFPGGGISKIVLGILAPVETGDHVNWRALNLAYNFQAQYVPIPSVIFIWDRFQRDLRKQKKSFETNGLHERDLTRDMIYGAIELYLDKNGKPGRQCLMKAICDAAEHPIHCDGVFEEIVHLILTPNMDEDIDVDFKNARQAGEYSGNCNKLYTCPFGDGLLDKLSVLQ